MEIKSISFDKNSSKLKSYKEIGKLYYIGDINLINGKCVAVIGKRETTEYYEKIAFQVGKVLARNGYVVMNGLARGCDKSALMGALSAGGKVLAVLPCGLDKVYPASNSELAKQIVRNGGCLVSQYPVGVRPAKYRFLERDRIQVLLCNRLFVIDSGIDGGTMYTAKTAIKYNRPLECFAMNDRVIPEGNRHLMEKYGLSGVRNNEDLLKFASYEEPVQLSFV